MTRFKKSIKILVKRPTTQAIRRPARLIFNLIIFGVSARAVAKRYGQAF